MNLPKLTFKPGSRIQLAPARVAQIAAKTVTLSSIDFAKVKWLDDPGAQVLIAKVPGLPELVIMGNGAQIAAPYNPAWQQADAQAALLAQFPGASVDANNVVTVAVPAPTAPAPPAASMTPPAPAQLAS